LHPVLGRERRRRGQIVAGQRTHQQPAAPFLLGGSDHRRRRLALRLQPAQARDLVAQLTEGVDHFRFQEGIGPPRTMHAGNVRTRYADRLLLDARIGQRFLPGARQGHALHACAGCFHARGRL